MRTWTLTAGAAVVSASFVVGMRLLSSSGHDVTVVSDATQLLAAVLAAVGCAVGARRSSGQQRWAWRLLSAGTACWAAGQAAWSWYEVVLDRPAPFPSSADVGYLLFPLVAGAGLVVWPGRNRHHALTRGRDVMDGAIIALSLFVLSWVTVMAPLVSETDVPGLPLVLSLAYPVGDVVLATLVLLLLSRADTDRVPLALLALGLAGFVLADSLFTFLTSEGTYSSANLISSGGWVTGFLLMGVAGATASRALHPSTEVAAREDQSSWALLLLPYVPFVAAGLALYVNLVRTDTFTSTNLLLGAGLVVMVLVRQFLAMVDNQRLMDALGEAGAKLEHIATHDALTELPNRSFFAARLDHALASASSGVAVLFCDLDNFKPVNDVLGHAAGDQLLRIVALRLQDCVRAGDTVARLGGDEFAIVLVDCDEPEAIAQRVVASMREVAVIQGHAVQPSISVGLAQQRVEPPTSGRPSEAPRPDREVLAERLLRTADTAMYAAKTAGKGRATELTSGEQVSVSSTRRRTPSSG